MIPEMFFSDLYINKPSSLVFIYVGYPFVVLRISFEVSVAINTIDLTLLMYTFRNLRFHMTL